MRSQMVTTMFYNKRSLQAPSPLPLAASRLASLATRNGELVRRLTGFGSPFQSLAPLKGEGSLSSGRSAFHQVKVLAASCRSVMNLGAFLKHLTKLFWGAVIYAFNYRLTHSASELSGFTCTSSLTMKEKFQYRTRLCRVRYWKQTKERNIMMTLQIVQSWQNCWHANTSTSLNEKFKIRNLTFQNRYPPSSCFLGVIKNFIINKRINVCIWQIVKLWVSRSHGVMTVVCWIYTTAITPR